MASLLNMSGGSLLGKGLPYDAEIEYLEGDGTSYIDTGYKGNTTKTKCEIQIMPLATYTQGVCGSRNTPNTSTDDNCCIFVVDRKFRLDWAKGSTGDFVAFRIGNIYTISVTRGSYTINGTTKTYTQSTSIDQDYTFLLLSLHNASEAYYAFLGRLYYAKLYENNTLIMDLIPVRVGSTGYMYDKVSGQLFGNVGTGDFILGPDKTN